MYKINYTRKAVFELDWFSLYYLNTVPEGQKKAFLNLKKTLEVIAHFPETGTLEDEGKYRTFNIKNTKFSLLYNFDGKTVNILSVWDNRRNPVHKEIFWDDLL